MLDKRSHQASDPGEKDGHGRMRWSPRPQRGRWQQEDGNRTSAAKSKEEFCLFNLGVEGGGAAGVRSLGMGSLCLSLS